MTKANYLKNTLFLFVIFLALSGCGTTPVAADPRSLSTINDDQSLRHQLKIKFAADPDFQKSHVTAASYNHNVLLIGETPISSVRVKAEKIARDFSKVRRIYNEIRIINESNTAHVTQTSRDAWITTKVKTLLIANLGLAASGVKVITEHGSVYLLGKLSHEQAALAISVARQVSHVQRVVKLFEYTNKATG